MTEVLDSGRNTEPREVFDPIKVSPSRVNAYVSCGYAFKLRYIDRIPEQRSGSAALYGLVIHHALERWSLNRTHSLVGLVAQAWMAVTQDTVVQDFIREYQGISIEVMKAEKEAVVAWESKNPGKTSQAPRMTKVFKESDAAQKLNRLLGKWIPVLNDQSPWRFSDRDPLPTLYDESLISAKKYAARWKDLPSSMHTEFHFTVPWRGFILDGYVDSIEPVLDPVSGELSALMVLDYKTYRKEPAEYKDWRQVVMYDVAVAAMIESGQLQLPAAPIHVGVDYFRLRWRRDWKITAADHDRLESELTMYNSGVSAGVFLPAEKGRNPDFCDYPEQCCLTTRPEGMCGRGGIYRDGEDA